MGRDESEDPEKGPLKGCGLWGVNPPVSRPSRSSPDRQVEFGLEGHGFDRGRGYQSLPQSGRVFCHFPPLFLSPLIPSGAVPVGEHPFLEFPRPRFTLHKILPFYLRILGSLVRHSLPPFLTESSGFLRSGPSGV